MKKNIQFRDVITLNPVRNKSVVQAQLEGYATDLTPKYKNFISDQTLRQKIMRMSVIEIIS